MVFSLPLLTLNEHMPVAIQKNIERILQYNYLLLIISKISTFNYLENVSKKYEVHSNYLTVTGKQKLYDEKLHIMTTNSNDQTFRNRLLEKFCSV